MLLSCISAWEKSEGFRLTRFFGGLASAVIHVCLPGVISSKREAGSSNQVAHVTSPSR